MKKIKNVIIMIFIGHFAIAQNPNDTTTALSIRAAIPGFDFKYYYTFDVKLFELNKDSITLFELTQKNPKPATLQPKNWSGYSDYSETYSDNHGWHPAGLSKDCLNSRCGPHDYICGSKDYKQVIEWASKDPSSKITRISKTIIVDDEFLPNKEKIAHLVLHSKIAPSEIFLGAVSSDCWAFPALTKYKKPKCIMRLIPDSLKLDNINLVGLKRIEKIINNPKVKAVIDSIKPIVKQSDSLIPKISEKDFDVVALKSDTISFQDFDMEDGDKISIFFDSILVQENISIEHKPYKVPVASKVSFIEIIIEDEGSSHPCTLQVIVNEKKYYFSKKKGEKIKIVRK